MAFSPGMGLLGGHGAELYCGFFRLILTGPTASADPPVPGVSCVAVRAPSDKAADWPRKDRRVLAMAPVISPPSLQPASSVVGLIRTAHDGGGGEARVVVEGENAEQKFDATKKRPRAPCRERDTIV